MMNDTPSTDVLTTAVTHLELISGDTSKDVADRKDALSAATSIRKIQMRAQKAQMARVRSELKAAKS